MVVVESGLRPPGPAVRVIPLPRDDPAVRHLDHAIDHYGKSFVLTIRPITAVLRGGVWRKATESHGRSVF